MISFEEFREKFLADVSAPDFFAERYSMPGARSPAAKELDKTQARKTFTDQSLRVVYRLLCEHSRLVGEQPNVRKVRKKNSGSLTKLQNAIETVGTIQQQLVELSNRTKSIIGDEEWSRAQQAMADCAYKIRQRQKDLSSEMHPAQRKPPALEKSGWQPVVKAYKYGLESLKKKAPDQWLYDALNSSVGQQLADFNISDMTRYRIMSSIMRPFGLEVKPITMKLHFRAQNLPSLPPVKKSSTA